MIYKYKSILIGLLLSVVCFNFLVSQEINEKSNKTISNRFSFFEKRGSQAVDLAFGSAIIEGAYTDTSYEVYFKAGYKLHITSHLDINFACNKYFLVVKDISDEDFMAFDLNMEYLLSPFRNFSPFCYVGGGYNVSNDFLNATFKVQGAIGVEYLLVEGLGLKLFAEYNHIFTENYPNDEVLPTEFEGLIRAGLGLNIYFGGEKKKEELRKKMKTVINSNLIIPYN